MSGFSSFTFGVLNYFTFTFSFQLGRRSHDPIVFIPQDLGKMKAKNPQQVSLGFRARCLLMDSIFILSCATLASLLPYGYSLKALTMKFETDHYQAYSTDRFKAVPARSPQAGLSDRYKALHWGNYQVHKRTRASEALCCPTEALPITLRDPTRDQMFNLRSSPCLSESNHERTGE